MRDSEGWAIVQQVRQKDFVRLRAVAGAFVIGGDRGGGGHILRGWRVAGEERFEISATESVEHHVAGGFNGVGIRERAVEALDADGVSGAANIAKGGGIGGLIPQQNRALLNHIDERRVRGGLPADVLVRFMELNTAVGGEGEQIGFVQELEGRMLLEEVCYPVGDGGGLHGLEIVS